MATPFKPHPVDSQSRPEARARTRTWVRYAKYCGATARQVRMSPRRLEKARKTAERMWDLPRRELLSGNWSPAAGRAYAELMAFEFERADASIFGGV